MERVFIKAECWNNREKDVFELSWDGDLHIIGTYLDCIMEVTESDMQDLRNLIDCVPSNIEKVSDCDGSAWIFTAYNDQGKQIYHHDIGCIYGIQELEKIAEILCSYLE